MNNTKKQKNPNPENIILQPTRWENFFIFCRDFFCVLGILLFISYFFIIPFRINGSSMETNYHSGEYIIVDRFSYLNFATHFDGWKNNSLIYFFGNILSKIPIHIGDPKRGDVVVLHLNIGGNNPQYYLKRIIGLPGETIRISDGNIFIQPQESKHFIQLSEGYLSPENNHETYIPTYIEEGDFYIPEGHYWVMGDNRKNSSDSRNCFSFCKENDTAHFIARKNILGKVALNLGYFEIFEENNFPKIGSFSWKYQPRFLNTPKDFIYPELSPHVLSH